MTKVLRDSPFGVEVEVSEGLLRLFDRLALFWTVDGRRRLEVGASLRVNETAKLSPYVGLYAGKDIPTVGPFSFSHSDLSQMESVGAYCSVQRYVRVMGPGHLMHTFSSTAGVSDPMPVFNKAYRELGLQPHYLPNPQKPPPVIGNDVWIGEDVILARGVSIGDGAVVQPGSIVAKDVPPYAIVAGTPANVVAHRFTEAERDLLQRSRWWEHPLPSLTTLPTDDVAAFTQALAQGVESRSIPRTRQFKRTFAEIIRAGRVEGIADAPEFSLVSPGLDPATDYDPTELVPSSAMDFLRSEFRAGVRDQFKRMAPP